MRILYGSQNFGYNNEQSDKDYIEFVYPSWEDILFNRKISKQEKIDTGIVKIHDIREISNILRKQNFSNLQFMFSDEYIDCEDLSWFIQHKDRLIKSNKYNLFKHNKGIILNNLELETPKGITRAYVYTQALKRIAQDECIESLKCSDGLEYRELSENIFGTHMFELEQEAIIKELLTLENYFIQYKDRIDTEILKEADDEIIGLLKKNVKT